MAISTSRRITRTPRRRRGRPITGATNRRRGPRTGPVGWAVVVLAVLALVTACGTEPDSSSPAVPARPVVVASTPLVGALVRSVGGDQVDVRVLAEPGSDPASATTGVGDPALDGAALVVLVDPDHHEVGLAGLATNPPESSSVLLLAPQLNPIPLGGSELDPASAAAGGPTDPHVWLDPDRWNHAAVLVGDALKRLDGVDAATVEANVAAFQGEVNRADETVQATFATVPDDRRTLVSDLAALGYIADRYGFELVLTDDLAEQLAAPVDPSPDAGGPTGTDVVFTSPHEAGALATTFATRVPLVTAVALDLDGRALSGVPDDAPTATAGYVDLLLETSSSIVAAVTG